MTPLKTLLPEKEGDCVGVGADGGICGNGERGSIAKDESGSTGIKS